MVMIWQEKRKYVLHQNRKSFAYIMFFITICACMRCCFCWHSHNFTFFGAWGIDVSWYIAMYFDLMPKESSVFSVAGSAYVQIGEKHQRKNQEGEKYCWQNLAGKTYKKLHPAETHKMCSSFWAFCIRDLWKHGIAYPQIKWDSWSLASFTLVFWRLQ